MILDNFLPQTGKELRLLLDAYLLEKAMDELGYDLNNRPDWIKIPLQGVLSSSRPVDHDRFNIFGRSSARWTTHQADGGSE